MRLILLGPPGSGKGTQAKLLSVRNGLAHIGTGDILREAARLGTPLGQKAAPFLSSGQLVPDDLVNEVVAERFRREDRPEAFVMDGYPRTLAQAASFDQVLRQQFLFLTAVLWLELEDSEIVERMSGRRTCPKCQSTYHLVYQPPKKDSLCDVCGTALVQREDDREETVRGRLRLYHLNTGALVSYYREQGLLHEIAAKGGIEDIYCRISEILKKAGSSC
jgi:adenylate kinase